MTSGPGAAIVAASVVRQALVPMTVFYLIFMAALGLGLLALHRRAGPVSRPQPAPAADSGPLWGWAALARHVLATATGGYLLLLAVVTAYYYGVARVGGAFLASAVTGTALLIGLAMPIFAAVAWISAKARGRKGKRPGQAQPPPP